MTQTFDLRTQEGIEDFKHYAVVCTKYFLSELPEKTGKASYGHWMKEHESRVETETAYGVPNFLSGGPLVLPGLGQKEIGKKIWIETVDAYFANTPQE